MNRLVFFLILSVPFFAGATSDEYKGNCKYINADGKIVFNQICDIAFVTFGADKGSTYSVTFNQNSGVSIGRTPSGKASVNGLDAKVMVYAGKVVAITDESEVFVIDDSLGR